MGGKNGRKNWFIQKQKAATKRLYTKVFADY